MRVIRSLLIVSLILNSVLLTGNSNETNKLTINTVLKGRLLSSQPLIMGWEDGVHFYRYDKGTYIRENAVTGISNKIKNTENNVLTTEGFHPFMATSRSTDFNRYLFVKDKTIFLYDRNEKKLDALIKSDCTPQNPSFSPDFNKIAYTLKGNLYISDISGKNVLQLTRDGNETILNGYASWVYYEEIMGRGSRYKAFWWNPNSNYIAFMRSDQSNVPIFPIYKADGDYGTLENQRYPKPGYPNPTVKIGIINLNTNVCSWIDLGEKENSDHYLAFPTWNQSGDKLFLQWMNREQNHLEILVYDMQEQKLQKVYEEKQNEWVEFFDSGDFVILKNDDLLIRSSKDGWHHIYLISANGNQKQLTSGNWTVNSIECVSEKHKYIYFTAGKEDSRENHLYKINFNGKRITKLTKTSGVHHVNVSPTGRFFIDQYSNLETPPLTELRNSRGELIKVLGNSYSKEIDQYRLAKGELFYIKIKDDIQLPALWFRPPDFSENKKYPVLLNIYGGPGSKGVQNRYYSSTNIFFLAQEGIICLMVDHRGSSHFGKKGITQMYRHLGKWEMHDYIEVVEYLRTLPYIDSEKIGITGHSYGGYLAALAMTYGADYFQYGIAASGVMDWKLYDSVYTERYMDTPLENQEGYKNSSVLTYIDHFKGTLRVTHGTMDDNVHLQNSLQLIDQLLDAGKTVELMIYPGERHGIYGPKWSENQKSDLLFWLKHLLKKNPEDY